ncbi:unnamed protein product [Merluccius merluccius]
MADRPVPMAKLQGLISHTSTYAIGVSRCDPPPDAPPPAAVWPGLLLGAVPVVPLDPSAMSEPRGEEQQEEEVGDRAGRDQAIDRLQRTKPDHSHSSQGPLSSIRAAIKRSRSTSQSDHARERRRPEITILSAEPLANSSWFPGASGIFTSSSPPPPSPASQSSWPGSVQADPQPPPSYDQVIKEKTQEEHVARPTAAPRRLACTSTSATQTDPVREETSVSPRLSPAGGTGRKPDDKNSVELKVPTDSQSTPVDSSTPSSDPVPAECPVPLPRFKKSRQKHLTEEVTVQTLVSLRENGDDIRVTSSNDQEEPSSNKYIEELLEVFGEDNSSLLENNTAAESISTEQSTVAGSEMSAIHSQRDVRGRIAAFETQPSTEEEMVVQRPKPQPRNVFRPPVSSKPTIASRTSFKYSVENNNVELPSMEMPQKPSVAPKPQKPSPAPRDLQETMPSRVLVLPPSRSSIMAKVKSLELQQESHALTRPVPPAKPFKEPVIPNTHNSTFMAAEDEYVNTPSNRAPFKPQHSLDSYPNKESISRRPTTIRVNSMATLSVDNPPPLPTQMPVGSLLPPVSHYEALSPALPSPETFNKGQEPTLPPRTSGGKVLPPRPPPAKAGPARPPPPSAGPVQASQRGPPSTAPVQKSKRRGPALPPRPRPGHHLYNKYTLELPHGIAVCNYNGPKTDELSFQKNDVLVLLEMVDHRTVMCQSGEIKGLVQSCHMRVITPLATQNDPPQITNPASSVGGGGLQVQAIHDFKPESQEELGLRVGDVVNMVEQVDDEWYRGTCRGSTGFFPINYVNVLSNSPLPSHEKKKPPATVSGPRCVARFDFEGEQDDELTFSEGDVIGLLEYVGDEWAKGQLGPCTGIFPLNFVDVIEEPLPLPPRQQQTQQQTQTRMALPGKNHLTHFLYLAPQVSGPEWVVALYDFNGQTREDLSFRQGDRILVTKHLDVEWWTGRLNGREGVFPRAFVEGSQGTMGLRAQKKSEAGGSRARALFQFTADCEEELSLQAGDVITNLETVDEEWFLGDLRGKRALVPKTYVQVLG